MSDSNLDDAPSRAAAATAGASERTWQMALDEGQADEALSRYQRQDLRDEATLEELRTAADLRSQLRAKAYANANKLLEGTDLPASIIDWGKVRNQVDTLQESQEALDKLEPEAAIELLDGVDQPLLQAEAETQRGTAKVYRNEPDAAAVHFGEALARDPKHYRALTNRGNLALEGGRVDDAIADYQHAIEINESFSNAHHNLGVAYRKKGDISRSVSSIRRAQRLLHRGDADAARNRLGSGGTASGPRLGRWFFYGALAVVIYLVLRGQGII